MEKKEGRREDEGCRWGREGGGKTIAKDRGLKGGGGNLGGWRRTSLAREGEREGVNVGGCCMLALKQGGSTEGKERKR